MSMSAMCACSTLVGSSTQLAVAVGGVDEHAVQLEQPADDLDVGDLGHAAQPARLLGEHDGHHRLRDEVLGAPDLDVADERGAAVDDEGGGHGPSQTQTPRVGDGWAVTDARRRCVMGALLLRRGLLGGGVFAGAFFAGPSPEPSSRLRPSWPAPSWRRPWPGAFFAGAALAGAFLAAALPVPPWPEPSWPRPSPVPPWPEPSWPRPSPVRLLAGAFLAAAFAGAAFVVAALVAAFLAAGLARDGLGRGLRGGGGLAGRRGGRRSDLLGGCLGRRRRGGCRARGGLDRARCRCGRSRSTRGGAAGGRRRLRERARLLDVRLERGAGAEARRLRLRDAHGGARVRVAPGARCALDPVERAEPGDRHLPAPRRPRGRWCRGPPPGRRWRPYGCRVASPAP